MNKKTCTPDIKKCRFCGEFFKKKSFCSRYQWENLRIFCSIKCSNGSRKGGHSWNHGIKIDRKLYPKFGHLTPHTEESLLKITIANKNNAKKHPKSFYQENQKLSTISGLKNHSFHGTLGKKKDLSAVWLGDSAVYNSIHRWIQKNWNKTGICQKCGSNPHPYGKRHFGTEWHSLDSCYNRDDITTWIEVCKKCHNVLDKHAIRLR